MSCEQLGYFGTLIFISGFLLLAGAMLYDQKKQQQEKHKKS